ncbi:MAG: hypothetical protein F9K40_19945 [Kofleriaceae bacterium]|nr:MAG: hypothetical protein F9K40_19945 [Kofleriaceae bacterium]MBZ0233852.1 hypothetical protein [Kofleriaceae bacterium]
MEELIETIRAAVASDATAEQKTRGAEACRALATALNAEPGKPIAAPNAPMPHPFAGMPLGQVLDLVIAKLSAALPAENGKATPHPPSRGGLRIQFVPAPTRPRPLGASGRAPTFKRKP